MESVEEISCSVIQYYKGSEAEENNANHSNEIMANGGNEQVAVVQKLQEEVGENKVQSAILEEEQDEVCDLKQDTFLQEENGGSVTDVTVLQESQEFSNGICNEVTAEIDDQKCEEVKLQELIEPGMVVEEGIIKIDGIEYEISESRRESKESEASLEEEKKVEKGAKGVTEEAINSLSDSPLQISRNEEFTFDDSRSEDMITEEKIPKKRGRKRKRTSENGESDCGGGASSQVAPEDNELMTDNVDSDWDAVEDEEDEDDSDEEIETKPRRRGRCKKNPDIIPPHLSSDIVLGYKILLKFLETPQFSGFHKSFTGATTDETKITCLNQIKKKFEENSYRRVADFVNDVREMLTNIYESKNTVAIKRALRLEQVLEQRIAQLPNYLRPQCALLISPDDVNNSHNKIRINKGGGFVSLLLEKAEKRRSEKDKEKRKLLAEERKQLKEEQDKDVQEWEKNVLMIDHEEEIKSMWELPVIGHFIHLCIDILNIGEIAQYEVERMLLMPQCSDTLDLIMTALLSNSLVRAKLDRTPSMPYTIWAPLVRTRVISWYRAWHREGRNAQKIFEEIGVEPQFWEVLGPDINPLDYYYFHEISLVQRVWILKTLCDVDFVRKKTVYDNIRAQTLDELNAVHLGIDRHGNRYIQLKQFCGPDMRIYRQGTHIEGDLSSSELVESAEGFEYREGPITTDKVFKDIWEVGEKVDTKSKKKKAAKKKVRKLPKIAEPLPKKNLRQSARAKQKTYVDWSDSDQSDTDLATLKNKLCQSDSDTLYRPFSDKEFISLSVFRLPRDKVNKPTPKKSSYVRKSEDISRSDSVTSDKTIKVEDRKDSKTTGFEEEATDSLDLKQMQDMQMDFEKNFQMDDTNEDEFALDGKITNFNKNKFTVKNLENLKMVLKKGAIKEEAIKTECDKSENACTSDVKTEKKPSIEEQYDAMYKYNVPNHLLPDSSKFYLVVDSVDGLRQLISKFASHENDLEIISRSTKSSKKSSQSSSSCEVELIERLQNLLVELEPWELDLLKSSRSNREKLYKEYMNFINRPTDFIHPNESYWMKMYEEPPPVTTNATSATTTTTTTTTTASSSEKTVDSLTNVTESTDLFSQASTEDLGPRKRTRVTRLQLKLDEEDELDEELGGDDELFESSESDDNWELPVSHKKKSKKEPPKTPKSSKKNRRNKASPAERNDSNPSTTDKSTQSPSPDKAKKALFWGPRSSDPSEDLNWETNRQKILEKHNSPTKKVLFKADEIMDDMTELENALQNTKGIDQPLLSPTKRFVAQIPGNKKPYFSTAQLKAMEHQAKQKEQAENIQNKLMKNNPFRNATYGKPNMRTASTQSNVDVVDITNEGNKSLPMLRMTETQILNNRKPQTTAQTKKVQQINKLAQPTTSSPIIFNRNEQVNCVQQGIQRVQLKKQTNQMQPNAQKAVGQVQYQTVNHLQRLQPTNQVIQVQKQVGQVQEYQMVNQIPVQQKPISQLQQIQIQQPVNQIQQIQIPVSQIQQQYIQQNNKTITSTLQGVRLQQPTQLQTVRMTGTPQTIQIQTSRVATMSQPIITQTQPIQVQTNRMSGIQQLQVQTNKPTGLQQSMQIQTTKIAGIQQPVQIQTTKIAGIQQSIQMQAGTKAVDNDLYFTDGKVLIKADNNFVQQFMQKDKVLTLNLGEKFDFKRPLFIVKPKAEVGSNQNLNPTVVQTQQQNPAPVEPSTSQQQNILVFNKPQVQQTVVPTSLTNFMIPTSYLVSDQSSQPQIDPQQNLTIVQQNPTYIIQQKQVVNKGPQPQIIKIINPQPMQTNQNIILSPTNIKFANQIVRPMGQSIITTAEQPTKPTPTLRFIRPQNVMTTQNLVQTKIVTAQAQPKTNVGNVMQIQSPRMEVPKSQNSVITSRIIPSMPATRMSTPAVQAQSVRLAAPTGQQQTRFVTNNTQGIRLVNRAVTPTKTTVITSTAHSAGVFPSSARSPGTIVQPVRYQNVNLQPTIIRPAQNRLQLTPAKLSARTSATITNPIIIKLEDDEDEIRIVEEKSQEQPVTVDYLHGELSVRETTQGWKYVVKASDGSDVILSYEQVEERRAANNGCMK